MAKNLTAVCVRLDPQTLRLLDALRHNPVPLNLNRVPHPSFRQLNRSEIIRHAITAGLDVLTSEPILELKAP